MGTYALALSSSSKPFLLPPKPQFQSSFSRLSATKIFNYGCSWSPTPFSISRISEYNKLASKRLLHFKVRSSSLPESTNEVSGAGDGVRTLQLGSMFAVWYLLNIYFNILNKQVLKVYPFPTTVTAFQFGCGTVLVLLMWALNLHKKPKINRSQFTAIFLLAFGHTAGNLLTNISLGKVSVSFTHTIKAMEPFFTVLISALFFRERPSLWVVSSLVPIVGGVALASFSEVSFNWTGFISAMASNLTNQTRNVFSKKLMVKKEETLDDINLFSIITIISFLLLTPAAIFLEGVNFSPSFLQNASSQGLNVKDLCVRALLSGVCFHSYQQVSYMILHMVSPVTHAVGNSFKEGGCDHIINNRLSYARLIDKFLRNWFGSCWGFSCIQEQRGSRRKMLEFLYS